MRFSGDDLVTTATTTVVVGSDDSLAMMVNGKDNDDLVDLQVQPYEKRIYPCTVSIFFHFRC